ncbi:MAG: response regulator [Desulfobacterales bacterium]|nr:response regulator [Desulfobacterales bacterium]
MVQRQGMKFRTKLYLGYAIVFTLMIIVSTVVYINISILEKNTKQVDHIHEVIRSAEKIAALLVDMETGVRGFLIAGKDHFLEPYQAGIDNFDIVYKRGKNLISDSPSQIIRWEELKKLKNRWLTEIAHPEIKLRREVSEGYAALQLFQELSAEPLGKEIFDELRNALDAVQDKFLIAENYEGADLVAQLSIDMLNQETGQQGFLLTGVEASLDHYNDGQLSFAEHYLALGRIDFKSSGIKYEEIQRIKTLAERWHEKVAIPGIGARQEVNKYPGKIEDVVAMLETGAGKKIMDEMRRLIAEMVREEEALLVVHSKNAEITSNTTILITIIGTLMALIIGSILSFIIVSDISRQLGGEPAEIESLTKQVAQGNISIDLVTEADHPTGVYASAISMVKNLNAVVDQVDAISRGDYSQQIEPQSDKDKLGHALARMTNTLQTVSAQNELDRLQKTGQTRLNEKLRGEKEEKSLAEDVITFLAEFFSAQVGAFYLVSPDGMLGLVASYAYRKRKNFSSRFAVGEGLVGQVAREQKPIIISEVPDDYIEVTSGTGKTTPLNIMIFPIQLMGKLKGVIELGSLQSFSEQDMAFLNQIAESVAIALNSAESRQKTQKLLLQTQKQAESLQSQQEELRESNELLEEQKKSLVESETELQSQQEELRQINEELEEQAQLLEEQKTATRKKNIELEKTRKIIEEKAHHLELTGKYKSEFLANMSHELRTPLNSILLLSRLLSDNKDANLTPKQQEYLQTIYLSGTELLELINEILDLSKVESGKMDVHLESVDLRELTQRVEQTFKPQAQNKNLDLNINLSSDIPARIKTDRQRLDQIIKNLFSNALKFTQAGSITLDIRRPADTLDLSAMGLSPQTAIALSVIDTGEGIPTAKQKLVFEAFQQADGTTSRKFGGTGLGLSIVRELSKLLGGSVHLESEPGKGCAFTVFLPETFDKPSPQNPKKPGGKNAPKQQIDAALPVKSELTIQDAEFVPDDRDIVKPEDKSILIIEDDSKFAKTLADLSREREYKVLIANDGETGLHFADYFKPDAIILDIGLPGMDGWSVISRLKDQPGTRHIPVHFMSAHDETVEARKMGAIGYITKPVNLSMLDNAFEKIEHLISGDIRTLLVVEDDDVQRNAIVELIGNSDVDIIQAANGEEAFKLIRSRIFDCIILDLGLPDISGIEFLTKMKDDAFITEIPIIVYTGKELTAEEEAIINEYAEKTIIKGVRSPEKLLDETSLFLHRIEENLPEEKRKMIRMLHDRESVFDKKKILVVDDDMRNVYATSNMLEEKGLEVLIATDGRNGIEKLDENPDTDLVLMDIMMPVMDGYEAMQTIRKDNRFKALPIIALTAKAMKGDRDKCIEAGASDYLSKPVNIDKLLSMMRVWLY